MAAIYTIRINIEENENRFHIEWYLGMEEELLGSFFTAAEITDEEIRELWQYPEYQLDIGRKLFRFLDGDSRYLMLALADANNQGEQLQLHIRVCQQLMDWPFELLAQEKIFLVPYRVHLIRRISDWGKEKRITPQKRPLKLLFMACSAWDVEPELNFEKEEEAIFRITENLPIEMDVEDSGSLAGLKNKLDQGQYDVVHLSGHANIDEKGCPFFIMEDELGSSVRVSPGELWKEALIDSPPLVLFLSGCRTGESPALPHMDAARSFIQELVENHRIPWGLGWGHPVSDEQASLMEEKIYHELSRGQTVLSAIQKAREIVLEKYDESKSSAWPLLRLFSNSIPANGIVAKNQKRTSQHRSMIHVYLKNSRVKILTEGFIGRRRHLQQSLRALLLPSQRVGVLIMGTGGLGKSCLAGKITERFPAHTLIIIHGKFNTFSLESALKDAFIQAQDKKGQRILSGKGKLMDKLSDLCATSFKQKNYLLLLDDFEQNMEAMSERLPGVLLPEAAELLKILLHYLPICGEMTRLIITCRYDFSLTEQKQDFVEERLEKVRLTSFQESEKRKKAQELEHISKYDYLFNFVLSKMSLTTCKQNAN